MTRVCSWWQPKRDQKEAVEMRSNEKVICSPKAAAEVARFGPWKIMNIWAYLSRLCIWRGRFRGERRVQAQNFCGRLRFAVFPIIEDTQAVPMAAANKPNDSCFLGAIRPWKCVKNIETVRGKVPIGTYGSSANRSWQNTLLAKLFA